MQLKCPFRQLWPKQSSCFSNFDLLINDLLIYFRMLIAFRKKNCKIFCLKIRATLKRRGLKRSKWEEQVTFSKIHTKQRTFTTWVKN